MVILLGRLKAFTAKTIGQKRLSVTVTRWWAGVDNAYFLEKSLCAEATHFGSTTPTSRVHALLGGLQTMVFIRIFLQFPLLIHPANNTILPMPHPEKYF
jgi:hypothetical protein